MNLLGVGFIERFNFILGYQKGDKVVMKEDLYLQPRKIASKPNDFVYCPSKGFEVGYLEDGAVVTFLEVNGEANRKGLEIGDKVLDIDNGIVSLSADSINNGSVTSYIRKEKIIRLKIERNNIKIDLEI